MNKNIIAGKNILVIYMIVCSIVNAVGCGSTQVEKQPVFAKSNDSLVKRGEYLVDMMGCNDCHTPMKMTPQGPARDMDRMLSGHPSDMPVSPFDTVTSKNYMLFNMSGTAVIGPWGASFSANLTSDETGIGSWTEEQFRKALTEGKYKGLEGTRPLLPPMPWENYKNISDADIEAIFAFLKSTRPVKNIVPMPVAPKDLAAGSK